MCVQVRCKPASLDSARCFVAQQPGTVSVWQGRDSSHREQRVALAAGRALAERLAEQPLPSLPLAAAEPAAATGDDDGDTATNGTSLGHQRRLSLSAHAQAQAPVLLSGTTPQDVHLDKLGLFTATGEQHNSKPSFANERHAGLLMWWAEGKWWVGKREELGHGRGWIKTKSEAARPDAPGTGHEWCVYSKEARTWVVAELACTTAHTVLLQSSSSSSQSAAAGEGLGVQLQGEKLGAYLESGEVNGKPCFSHHYYHNLLLWWAGGRWWVGKREELGQGRGWIKTKSEAARPDAPGAGHEWLVYSKEARRWVAAELACIDGGSLLALTAATATVALTAAASALTAAAAMPAAAPCPPPVVLRWDVRVVREGSEPDDFWQGLGGLSRRPRAVSQPAGQGASTPFDAPLAVPPPPRLFLWPHAAPRPDAPAAAGAAVASELAESEVFSFSQASLEQDATFLLDAGSAVFAWVGAAAVRPDEYGPEWLGQAAAGYARARAAVDGRDARGLVYTVHAGEEPSVFTSLFGAWSDEAAGRKEPPHEAARRLLLGVPGGAAAVTVAATGARSSTQAPRASMDRSFHPDAVTRGESAPASVDELPPPAALRHLSSGSPPRRSAPRSSPRCAGRPGHAEGHHTAGPTASVEDGHALDHAAAGEVVLQLATVGAYSAAASPSTPPTPPIHVSGQASLPRCGSAEAALPRSAASARRRASHDEAADPGTRTGLVEDAAAALPAQRSAQLDAVADASSPPKQPVRALPWARDASSPPKQPARSPSTPANTLSPGCALSRGGSAASATASIADATSPPKHHPARSPSAPPKTPPLNLSTLQLDTARALERERSAEGGALDSARRRAGAASAAAARLAGSDGAAYVDPETARFGYREIRYEWRAHGVNPTCKELYLHDDEFARLFGMGKAAFYAQRQWQQRDAKQKLHLF